MPPELVFTPDDLLLHDQGPSVMQHERQRRVMSCVLELGFIATHSESSQTRCARTAHHQVWSAALHVA